MASITSSNFGEPLQELTLGANMRVTPAIRIPALAARRSPAPQGLGACWGWTPAGEVSLNCTRTFKDSVNKNDTEFLFDCVAFTTPSEGVLRLYVTREAGITSITMPLVVVPNVGPSLSDQTYQLSQVFENGQVQEVYPGATEFDAPEQTQWLVIQSPTSFTWSPSAGSTLKITPATIAIACLLARGEQQATWTIAI